MVSNQGRGFARDVVDKALVHSGFLALDGRIAVVGDKVNNIDGARLWQIDILRALYGMLWTCET